MKKAILLMATFAMAVASQAVVIYDTLTPATGFNIYTGTGNTRAADNFLPLAAPVGQQWNINSVQITGFASVAGAYNVNVQLNIFSGVGVAPNATDPALSSLVFTNNYALGVFNAASPGSGFGALLTVNALLPTVPVNVAAGYAIEIVYSATTGPGTISTGYVNNGSTVGSWSNGFFADLNGSGVLQNNEFANFANWTNGNVAMQVNATAVPEPATMVALGVGALALLRRRKKA